MSKNWNMCALCPNCSAQMQKSTYETWYCTPCNWHFDYDDARIHGAPAVAATGKAYATAAGAQNAKASQDVDGPCQEAPKAKKEVDYFAINRMFR